MGWGKGEDEGLKNKERKKEEEKGVWAIELPEEREI